MKNDSPVLFLKIEACGLIWLSHNEDFIRDQVLHTLEALGAASLIALEEEGLEDAYIDIAPRLHAVVQKKLSGDPDTSKLVSSIVETHRDKLSEYRVDSKSF